MDSSRYGARIQGTFGANLLLAAAWYKSYMDTQSIRLVTANHLTPYIEFSFPDVNITALSGNYYCPILDVVFRSEIAYFEHEPVNIADINIPADLSTGKIVTRDFLKFSASIDRDLWLRVLNSSKVFQVTLQYIGSYCLDYDDRQHFGIPEPDSNGYASQKEYEQSLTLVLMTSYLSGNLEPQFIGVYDPRGTFFLQPTVGWKFGPGRQFEFKLQYSTVFGNFTGVGFFKDRDQVTGMLSCSF